MESKTCIVCNQNKSPSEFRVSYKYPDGKTPWCKECRGINHAERNRIWRLVNSNDGKNYRNSIEWRRRNRERLLLRNHGLTWSGYQKLLEKANYQCEICGISYEENERGKPNLVVDHCHVTHEIRGILCHPCNRLLGIVKDDVVLLEKIIDYLKY